MIYLFLEADEFLVSQRLAVLKQSLGDPELADLNTEQMEGVGLRVADLLGQARMMPFLASGRLIIVHNLLTQLDKRMASSKQDDSAAHKEAALLLTGLFDLPDTAQVVLLEAKSIDRRRQLWKGFRISDQDGDGERKIEGLAAIIRDKRILLEQEKAPDARALPGWIQRRASEKGLTLQGQAVQKLALFVGSNLRQLDNELDKLGTYAAGRRITADDVDLLVSDASEAKIWDLTDALSRRNGRGAMHSLVDLRRNDANPFYIMTMIARQYRIIIKVKDAMAAGPGSENEIAKRVQEHPFVVKKAMQQARQYTFDELHMIMNRLLETDYAMKTGYDTDTLVDMLVADLTRNAVG